MIDVSNFNPPIIYLNGSAQQNISIDFFETPSLPRDPIPITTDDSVITDADTTSPRLSNITVTLTGAVDPTEQILFSDATSHPNTISTNRHSLTYITLVALNSPSAEDYITIVKDIRYSNNEEEPTPGVRLVLFRTSDELFTSLSITSVNVIEVNDLPVLFLSSAQVEDPIEASYTQGALPVLFIFGANIIDIDSNIVRATIKIQIFDSGEEIISVSQREAESNNINFTTTTTTEATGMYIYHYNLVNRILPKCNDRNKIPKGLSQPSNNTFQ